MRKIYTKLIAVIFELALAISVVVMSSYAWMVLSGNPAAEGIQITIGGGNTILVAADLTKEVGGVVYHYPDTFRGTLNFGQHESYRFLNDLGNLTPVSTADGLNWFLPAYYDLTDQEVLDGTVLSGSLKDIDEFRLDDTLKYANLSNAEEELAADGSYMYLDFWVVSPGEEYTLRVSSGEDGNGSFAIDLMQAEEKSEGYTLVSASSAAECVRVGFLVNPDEVTDNTMKIYQNEPSYSEQYRKLRGAYMEPEGDQVYAFDYRFTVYEPNGDSHSNAAVANGSYAVTRPIGLAGGKAYQADIRDRLTVQKSSTWKTAENGVGTQIEQRFQTALREPSFQGVPESELAEKFYSEYLGDQVSPYVEQGRFLKKTETLYQAVAGSVAGAEYLTEEYVAGATDDVYIVRLEKNVPQRIRLFIWLEGEDIDCVNSASASSFAFRIELAGSNMEE